MRTLSSFFGTLGALGALWFCLLGWGFVEAGREGPLSEGVGVGVSDMALAKRSVDGRRMVVAARVNLGSG